MAISQHVRTWGKNYGTKFAKAAAGIALASKGKNATKNRKRRGPSRTTTKRRNKKKSRSGGFIDVQGTISTGKTIRYKTTKLDKAASFIGGQFRHETQAYGEITHLPADEINSQKCVFITTVYEQADTLGIFNQAYGNITASNPLNPFTVPIAINASSSFKFYLNSCIVKVNLTNMSAGASNITLYAAMAKNSKTSTADAINDWSEGQDDTSGALGQTKVSPTRIGAIPQQSKLFNMNWWVVDKKSFTVGPGGKINYTFSFHPRNLVDTEYWARNSYVRGMSIQIFAVTWGQMGRVAQPAAGGGALPYDNLPMPKPVDWVYNMNKHYDSKAVQHFPRSLIQIYQNPDIKISDVGRPINVREDDGEIEA